MAQPQYYPDWATQTINLPGTNRVNKVRPRAEIRNYGMDYSQIMACEEVNWYFNNIGTWIRYFNEEFIPTLPNTYLPRTGTKVSLSGDATGSAIFNNSNEITIDTTVVDNSHNHISDNITDACANNVPNKIVKRDANGFIGVGLLGTDKLEVTQDYAYVNGKSIVRSVNGRTADNTGNISVFPVLPGTIVMWPAAWVPAGYLECNGQAFDVNANPNLYGTLGTNTVPDMRGLFVRGWAHGFGGYDPDYGRNVLSLQDDMTEGHEHQLQMIYQSPGLAGGHIAASSQLPNSVAGYETKPAENNDNISYIMNTNYTKALANNNPETRPKNIALMYIIKTDA